MKGLKEIRDTLSRELENGATLREGPGTAESTAKQVGILYGMDLFLVKAEFEEEEES